MAKVGKNTRRVQDFAFGKRNINILAIGLVVLVIGYILMAQPPVNGFLSRTLAPVILVVGYLVIIPISIMIGEKKNKERKRKKEFTKIHPFILISFFLVLNSYLWGAVSSVPMDRDFAPPILGGLSWFRASRQAGRVISSFKQTL